MRHLRTPPSEATPPVTDVSNNDKTPEPQPEHLLQVNIIQIL